MTTLLHMSFAGGAFIALIALVRAVLQHRLSRRLLPILWLLAALRLLLPVFIQTSLLPADVTGAAAPAATYVETRQPSYDSPAQTVQAEPAAPPEPVSAAVTEAEHSTSLADQLPVIWAVGAAALALIFAVKHLCSYRRYRFSLPLPEGITVPDGLRVRMLDGLDAPLTYGVFRPTILLPCSFAADNAGLQHILLHEQAHIRHHDVALKLVLLVALCLHWFNPLVWLMFCLASQDMEMRCDAEAVAKLGKRGRLSYARTLVAAEHSRLLGVTEAGFSFSSTAGRLRALAKGKARRVLTVVCALALLPLFLLTFLTGSSAAATPASQQLPVSGGSDTTVLSAGNDAVPVTLAAKPTKEPPAAVQELAALPTEAAPESPDAPSVPAPSSTSSDTSYSQSFSAWTDDCQLHMRYGDSQFVNFFATDNCTFYSDNPDVLRIFHQFQLTDTPGKMQFRIELNAGGRSGQANIYASYGGVSYHVVTIKVGPHNGDFAAISDDGLYPSTPGAGDFGSGSDVNLPSYNVPDPNYGFPIINIDTGYVGFP